MSPDVQVELNPSPVGQERETWQVHRQIDRQIEFPPLYPDANLEFKCRTSAPVTIAWLVLAMALGTLTAFGLLELVHLGIAA